MSDLFSDIEVEAQQDLALADGYSTTIPIQMQIAEIERELKYRAKVYPRLIDQGKMDRGLARWHYSLMLAAKKTLEAVL